LFRFKFFFNYNFTLLTCFFRAQFSQNLILTMTCSNIFLSNYHFQTILSKPWCMLYTLKCDHLKVSDSNSPMQNLSRYRRIQICFFYLDMFYYFWIFFTMSNKQVCIFLSQQNTSTFFYCQISPKIKSARNRYNKG